MCLSNASIPARDVTEGTEPFVTCWVIHVSLQSCNLFYEHFTVVAKFEFAFSITYVASERRTLTPPTVAI